ncbi:MAG: MATE family efflux transporter [Bradymonadia bacterium]
MLTAERRRRILTLALPIIGGMFSQNVLNLVDAAMVGTLGKTALAAVGLASFANFMCVAFITGMSVGVQAMSARRKGEGRHDETAIPLNGGLVLVGIIAVPASIVAYALAPELFDLLADDQALIGDAVVYFRARVVAMVAVGANFAFRGYWNAVDLSRLYMRTLIYMHIANIIISYVLIFGHLGLPAMGVAGAGIGTSASLFLGTVYYCYLGWQHAREGGFLRGLPSRATLATILRTAGPAGLQQFFFAAGMTTFYTMVEKVGIDELATTKVLTDLLLVAILPGLGFGISAASLVGQSLGQKDASGARMWGQDVAKLAAIAVSLIALPAIIMPELILSAFLKEPHLQVLAAWPLRLMGLTIGLDAMGMVFQNALLGAGDSRRVMIWSIGLQWGLALPMVYLVGPTLQWGLLAIWAVQLGYRLIQAGVFATLWRGDGWTRVDL